MRIPLRGAYVGLTAAPWISLAHSDIAPILALHPDAVETRVIWRRRRRPYTAVAWFEVRPHRQGAALVLAFRGTPFTFGAVIRNEIDVSPTAEALEARGCVRKDR